MPWRSKQATRVTYEELSFHLADPATYRAFCGYGAMDAAPSKTALQRNIKRISETTWEKINRILVGYGKEQGIGDGRTTRTDATVTETASTSRPILRCCGTRFVCSRVC